MNPAIESLRQQYEAVKAEAGKLGSLTRQQWQWQPGAGRWSAAQCIDHLNVTLGLYNPVLESAIKSARAHGWLSDGPYSYGWLSKYFVKLIEPPVSRRFKAPGPFVPSPQPPVDGLLDEFMRLRTQGIRLIEAANGLDLNCARVQSPASKLLKLPLGKAIEGMAAHDRRHLWQVKQLMADPGFPK